ncbi:MAG: hypothetical protein RLY93_20275 [Sumerlaeia bacterium]
MKLRSLLPALVLTVSLALPLGAETVLQTDDPPTTPIAVQFVLPDNITPAGGALLRFDTTNLRPQDSNYTDESGSITLLWVGEYQPWGGLLISHDESNSSAFIPVGLTRDGEWPYKDQSIPLKQDAQVRGSVTPYTQPEHGDPRMVAYRYIIQDNEIKPRYSESTLIHPDGTWAFENLAPGSVSFKPNYAYRDEIITTHAPDYVFQSGDWIDVLPRDDIRDVVIQVTDELEAPPTPSFRAPSTTKTLQHPLVEVTGRFTINGEKPGAGEYPKFWTMNLRDIDIGNSSSPLFGRKSYPTDLNGGFRALLEPDTYALGPIIGSRTRLGKDALHPKVFRIPDTSARHDLGTIDFPVGSLTVVVPPGSQEIKVDAISTQTGHTEMVAYLSPGTTTTLSPLIAGQYRLSTITLSADRFFTPFFEVEKGEHLTVTAPSGPDYHHP